MSKLISLSSVAVLAALGFTTPLPAQQRGAVTGSELEAAVAAPPVRSRPATADVRAVGTPAKDQAGAERSVVQSQGEDRDRAGGGDVGFWDLLDADLLPSETAQYVPIIEAFALILENLQRLKFAGTQMRAPEVTADLNAAGGTRLSLVARAAATSVNQLRLLNLDVKGETVPNIPGQLFPIQVPKDVVWQARDTLQDLSTHAAYEDQCVPPTFDWGKQRFTRDMEEDCRARFGGAAPARVAGPASSR